MFFKAYLKQPPFNNPPTQSRQGVSCRDMKHKKVLHTKRILPNQHACEAWQTPTVIGTPCGPLSTELGCTQAGFAVPRPPTWSQCGHGCGGARHRLRSERHHLYRHQLRDTGGHAVPREGKETSKRAEVTLADRSCLLPAKLPTGKKGREGLTDGHQPASRVQPGQGACRSQDPGGGRPGSEARGCLWAPRLLTPASWPAPESEQ